MNGMRAIILALIIVGLAGGVFLANWHIPAPTKMVTKAVPDENFTK